MKETGALLAGEMSGHTFFSERWYGFDDGMYAGARLLEILSRSADPSAVLHALPDSVSTPELNIDCADVVAARADRRARAGPRSFPAPRMSSASTACASNIPTASGSRAHRTRRRSSCCASKPRTTAR